MINSVVGEEDQVSGLSLFHPYTADKLSELDINAIGIDKKIYSIQIQNPEDEKHFEKER